MAQLERSDAEGQINIDAVWAYVVAAAQVLLQTSRLPVAPTERREQSVSIWDLVRARIPPVGSLLISAQPLRRLRAPLAIAYLLSN